MNKTASTVLGVAAASALAAGACGAAAFAETPSHDAPAEGDDSVYDVSSPMDVRALADQATQVVQLQEVHGAFSFEQGLADSIERITRSFNKVPRYLCGAAAGPAQDVCAATGEALGTITVKGEVRAAFTASLNDMASKDDPRIVMGCACGGNPVDGRASVSAEVTGVTVRLLLERAQVDEGVNTIVFTSADGYAAALPLSYVRQRHSLIVYAVNGEPVENVMGGSNQLWLGSTSARYFARDIVSIKLLTQATPPPAPGSAAARDAGTNTPNVAVLGGGALS